MARVIPLLLALNLSRISFRSSGHCLRQSVRATELRRERGNTFFIQRSLYVLRFSPFARPSGGKKDIVRWVCNTHSLTLSVQCSLSLFSVGNQRRERERMTNDLFGRVLSLDLSVSYVPFTFLLVVFLSLLARFWICTAKSGATYVWTRWTYEHFLSNQLKN